eukprot:2834932-Pyramimonas_sp.AAC.1
MAGRGDAGEPCAVRGRQDAARWGARGFPRHRWACSRAGGDADADAVGDDPDAADRPRSGAAACAATW